jgi:APA family basic amino acid/polyamine antiporter
MPASETNTAQAAPGRGLLRVLGMAFALAIGVGSAIGGGILRTPGEVAALLPDPALFMGLWIFGAVNTLLGATVYAELGAMMPAAGGVYTFARRALGEFAGFFVGYTYWIQLCAISAALALLVGEYAGALLPALAGHATAVAFTVLAAIVAAQWHGVRTGSHIQIVTTFAKVLALAALVVAAFVMPIDVPAVATAAAPPFPHGAALLTALLLATQSIIFTYDGYHTCIFFGEELRDPGRELPRAIFRGVFLIITVFVLLNVAFLHVLPIGRMAHESFVGGAVAQALFGARGELIIRAIVIVSIIGTINAVVLQTARVLLAMGRDGLFAHQATVVNSGGTPTVAMLSSTVVTALFMLSGSFTAVLPVDSVFVVVGYLLMFAALFALRRNEPAALRPYRAWGYPWTTALAMAVGVIFLIGVAYSDPYHGAIALACLIVSYPLYRGMRLLRFAVAS